MNLKKLHEQFIEKANRPMDFGALPIKPKESQEPVLVAVDRWRKVNNSLIKTYTFRRINDRDKFINCLLTYERSTKHHALITIIEDQVTLEIQTRDIKQVTEVDKEYAAYADSSFKELVYYPSHEDECGFFSSVDE